MLAPSHLCLLEPPTLALAVQQSLLHFNRTRYHLVSWAIMPDHVHTILAPLPGFTLSSILRGHKSFTAHQINQLTNRTGPVWQRESFDRVIRDQAELERRIAYIDANPVEAGLCNKPEDWRFSSRGTHFKPPAEFVFHGLKNLPWAVMRERGRLPHLHCEGGAYYITYSLLGSWRSKQLPANSALPASFAPPAPSAQHLQSSSA